MTEPAFAELGLRVERRRAGRSEVPVLVPAVDGRDLFGDRIQVKGIGRDPDTLLGRRSPLLPAEWPEQPRTALLWRCTCGIEGCGFASARIERDRNQWDHVVWTDFTLHCLGDAEPPGEIRFRTAQYIAEIVRCHADRSWETTTRRITRQVAATLDADPGILGKWGCGLHRAMPDDRNDAVFLLIKDGSAEHSWRHPAAAGATEVVAALRATDPRESAERTYPRPG